MLKCSAFLLFCVPFLGWADQVVMRNGDTYNGAVLSLTANVVVLKNDNLGQVSLPRAKVATIHLGAIAAAPGTNAQARAATNAPVNPEADLSVLFRGLRSQSNLVQQVQSQVLGSAGPEAVQKFNELLDGLSTGSIDLNALRAEAQRAADQLRALKQELGADADDVPDDYLVVLEAFLGKSAPAGTTTNKPAPSPALPHDK